MKKQRKILKKNVFALVYAAVIVVCILLDQLTKLWIFDGLLDGKEGNGVDVLGKFLRFVAVYNEGAAFGIAQDDGANIVFFVITLLGVPLFLWLLWRSRTRSVWGQVGYAFIVGGTLGNAIDRAFIANTSGAFFSGKVRDFISFSIFPPIFNVADSFLVIGVVFAVVAILFLDYDGLLATAKQSKTAQVSSEDSAPQSSSTAENHSDFSQESDGILANSENGKMQNESSAENFDGANDTNGASKTSGSVGAKNTNCKNTDKNAQKDGDGNEKN